MKNLSANLILCVLIICTLLATPALAQSKSDQLTTHQLAEKILNAYGGEAKFKEAYEAGWHGFGKYTQISLLSGAANIFDVEIFNKGNMVRQEMKILGEQVAGGYDGKHSWLKQSGEVIEDNPSKADFAREEIEHGLRLLLKLSANNTHLRIIDSPNKESLSRCPALKNTDILSVKPADSSSTLIYADKQSHLIVATEFKGLDEEQGLAVKKSFQYDNYRPLAGTMMPYKFIEYSGNKKVLEIVLLSIKSENLADEIFKTPKAHDSLLGKDESVTIPFRYVAGEIVIHLGINGKPNLAFVVDTGATQTLIDSSEAPKLGKIEKSDWSITTGSGSVPMGYMTLDSVALGTLVFKSMPVAVADLSALTFIPGTKITGLLGANVLRQFLITFDFPKHTITFAHPDSQIDTKHSTVISARPSLGGSALMVPGNLDGTKLEFLIDTGAAYSLIPHELAAEFSGRPAYSQDRVHGLDGKQVAVASGRFKALHLGNVTIDQPEFFVAGQNAKLGGMISNGSVAILGNPTWKNYSLTLDYKKQRIILNRPILSTSPSASAKAGTEE